MKPIPLIAGLILSLTPAYADTFDYRITSPIPAGDMVTTFDVIAGGCQGAAPLSGCYPPPGDGSVTFYDSAGDPISGGGPTETIGYECGADCRIISTGPGGGPFTLPTNTATYEVYTSHGYGFILSDEDGVIGTAQVIPQAPLPSTLPLFATGLGALGLLGWRRKRKAQPAA